MVRGAARASGTRTDAEASGTPLRILHVVVQAGPTNSQWNEHCLPVADEREVSVCSLLPATVAADPRIARVEGDGTARGALRVLRGAVRRQGFDVVHVHAPVSAALLLLSCVLERRGWSRAVFTLHNAWPNLRPRNRVLAAVALIAFPTVVACSRSAAASIPAWLRRLAGFDLDVDVVPNGVDVDRVDRALMDGPAQQDGAGRARPGITLVTVGRLIEIKDHATLIAAFAMFARPLDRLVIIGEGPLRGALEAQADRLGLADQVSLPGLLPRDEVYRALGRADVYVSSSRGEGLPVSVLEAMAAGVPSILSDIPPHREIVGSHLDVPLVRCGDAADLASAIGDLALLDGIERAAGGLRGRQAVLDRASIVSMSAGYHRIYSHLIRPLESRERV